MKTLYESLTFCQPEISAADLQHYTEEWLNSVTAWKAIATADKAKLINIQGHLQTETDKGNAYRYTTKTSEFLEVTLNRFEKELQELTGFLNKMIPENRNQTMPVYNELFIKYVRSLWSTELSFKSHRNDLLVFTESHLQKEKNAA